MKKTILDINECTKVSVIEFNENHFEIAVLVNAFPTVDPDGWEIDYTEFKDVLIATTPMEVYGMIEHQIKPAYL